MSKQERMQYLYAAIIALLIAGSAGVYKFYIEKPEVIPKSIPLVGAVGSDHAHASLLVMAKDKIVNFCAPEFMLRSQYVHFEDNNCYTIHRHATGITLPTFFKTIGVELTPTCLSLPNGVHYCQNGEDHISVMINGKDFPVSDLAYYEFKNNDHILVNYGPETGAALKFKYNNVPQIPLSVNEPIRENDDFGKVIDTQPLVNTPADTQ